MPRAVGAAHADAIGDGGLDDRAWLGRASGRRRPVDARGAQWLSHPDDGTAGVARRERQRRVAWRLSDYLCLVRVRGSRDTEMAAGSWGESQLRQCPWSWDRTRLPDRHLRT